MGEFTWVFFFMGFPQVPSAYPNLSNPLLCMQSLLTPFTTGDSTDSGVMKVPAGKYTCTCRFLAPKKSYTGEFRS